ncbi:MAG: hypothetical protein AB8F95_20425 [Bacteroidia bacterium]
MKNLLKSWLYPFLMRKRVAPEVQIGQRALYLSYQEMAQKGQLPRLNETGFRVFSQFEEDGMLLFIFALMGISEGTFVDIGSADGIHSNCANLVLNHGWHGLYIDGNPQNIKRGRKFYSKFPHPWMYPPKFAQAMVTRENINQVIEQAGFTGDIELLSVDIDGNDYWIWDALEIVQPKVVIIETHVEYGMHDIITPYDPNYVYPGKHPHYHGASPVAMAKLGKKKGYRLVGANSLGFNFIFIKEDLIPTEIPAVSVESVLQHPSVEESWAEFEPIKDWEYITE